MHACVCVCVCMCVYVYVQYVYVYVCVYILYVQYCVGAVVQKRERGGQSRVDLVACAIAANFTRYRTDCVYNMYCMYGCMYVRQHVTYTVLYYTILY